MGATVLCGAMDLRHGLTCRRGEGHEGDHADWARGRAKRTWANGKAPHALEDDLPYVLDVVGRELWDELAAAGRALAEANAA